MEPAVYVIGSDCQQCAAVDSLSGYWHLTHTALTVRQFCKLIKLKFLSGVLRIATMNTVQSRTIASSNSEGHIHTAYSRQEFLLFASCRSFSNSTEDASDSFIPNPVLEQNAKIFLVFDLCKLYLFSFFTSFCILRFWTVVCKVLLYFQK